MVRYFILLTFFLLILLYVSHFVLYHCDLMYLFYSTYSTFALARPGQHVHGFLLLSLDPGYATRATSASVPPVQSILLYDNLNLTPFSLSLFSSDTGWWT